jgi:beta-glucosidase
MTERLAYRDPALNVQARLDDLLSRMTLREKVGQLLLLDARLEFKDALAQMHPGALLHILPPAADEAMALALESRLGIPLLIAEDCIHGHSFWKGATIFPTQLALACSWNPELAGAIARATAREVAATGVHWTFSPVLCLTRDLRWGRVNETFGEDPHLIGVLAEAMIKAYQGAGLHDPEGILATAKHFAGYSETQGGRDASEADISRRKLRSYFLPPFERAARAGCMTFMTGYQSMEGVPSTGNRWLLREVLKEEWGFEGIVVTDWNNVGRLVTEQKTCRDYAHAAALAVKAGNDLMMTTPEFFQGALDAIDAGLLQEDEIDEPCRRILALKLKMGLFENPRLSDPVRGREVIACPAHQELNREAARQSSVLLQNNGLLPLDAQCFQRIAVIGPNADNDLDQLGDWSLGTSQYGPERGKHPRSCTKTVLDGLREISPPGCQVLYAGGCSAVTTGTQDIAAAAELAARSDVAVVVVGDGLTQTGEGLSTATLEFQGAQLALLDALAATGTPLLIVLINGKPLVLPPAVQAAAAIVEAFNPGMQGGIAIAEIIWGRVNPSGKLCVSFPRHVGQQPIFYSQVRGQHGTRYADLTQEPLFAFGWGLSYTTFRYDSLRVLTSELRPHQTAGIEIDVTNTGARAGDEVVQLYTSDEVTSATWVDQALQAFQRISLAPGETKTVCFHVPFEAFSIVDADARRVVEPGAFQIRVGSSSRSADLQTAILHVV